MIVHYKNCITQINVSKIVIIAHKPSFYFTLNTWMDKQFNHRLLTLIATHNTIFLETFIAWMHSLFDFISCLLFCDFWIIEKEKDEQKKLDLPLYLSSLPKKFMGNNSCKILWFFASGSYKCENSPLSSEWTNNCIICLEWFKRHELDSSKLLK